MRQLTILVIAIISLGLVVGCSPSPTMPTSEYPDDIIITPGGPQYRANIQQVGIENPWPPIQTVTVEVTENISVNYRAVIETKAGQTRSNIIFLYTGNPEASYMNFTLFFTDIPIGIEVKEEGQGVARPGVLDKELAILISQDVKPGEYTFEINAEFEGKDYGNIPCTIKVI